MAKGNRQSRGTGIAGTYEDEDPAPTQDQESVTTNPKRGKKDFVTTNDLSSKSSNRGQKDPITDEVLHGVPNSSVIQFK